MIKKNIFLIITFIAVAFFSATTLYIIENDRSINSLENDIVSSDSVAFSIDCKDETKLQDNITNIGDEYVLLKKKCIDLDPYMYGIYFKGKLKKIPPMISGRFFEENDFKGDNDYIVIGKNLKDNIVKKNDEDYYHLNNKYYKVIGILGDEKEESFYDSRVYINLTSLIAQDIKALNGEFMIDGGLNSKKIYETIESEYKKEGDAIELRTYDINKLEDGFRDISETYMEDLYKVLAFLVVNVFLITTYWVKRREKEISIKRAMGATRLKISFSILAELLITSFLAFLFGYSLFIAVSYIRDGYIHFYFRIMILIFLITFISGLLSSIIPIINGIKVKPAKMMR